MENMETLDLETLFGKDAPSTDLVGAARAVLSCRQEVDDIEKVLGNAKKALRNSEDLLGGLLEQSGVLSVKVDQEGGTPVTLSLSQKTYYALLAGSLEQRDVHLWLLRAGGHDIIRKTIHHATFSAFCRELVTQGRNLHPAIMTTEIKTISVRKK